MPETDDKQRNTFWYIWPDVTIREGQIAGMKAGAVAAAWLAFTKLSILGELYAQSMNQQEGQPVKLSDHGMEIAVALLLGAIAGGLAWLLWTQRSRVAACGILLWVAFEVLMRGFFVPANGLIIAVVALVCAVSGLRASLAYWKNA